MPSGIALAVVIFASLTPNVAQIVAQRGVSLNTKRKVKLCHPDLNERCFSIMSLQSESSLDSTDWEILREVQQNARLSYNELGRRVGLSAPAAAERIRKLEDKGVITSYSAQVNLEKVGLPLLAFIQLRCNPGKCLLKTRSVEEFPEILEIH